jgi:hypothetical protein
VAHDFKMGDHVEWNSEAGRVRGTIQKKHSSPIIFKGCTVHASREEPQSRAISLTTWRCIKVRLSRRLQETRADQFAIPIGPSRQMFGSRSKYSSSSFLPPSPLPSIFSDSMNSIRSIHLTIL